MPGKTFKYGDILYCWNPETEMVEKVTITTEPLLDKDVPKEVFQGLLKLTGNKTEE